MKFVMLTLALAFVAAVGANVTLTIELDHFEHNNGMALLSLFNDEEGFPTNPKLAYRQARQSIENGCAVIIFEDLPAGAYAVSVMHDEDNDNHMDSNFLGIPTEGWGASNNPKAMFGPPRWKDCRFEVGEEDVVIHISMQY